MAEELSTTEKIRRLPWALSADVGTIAYVYLTFSGPVFLLYLDALGLGTAQIGLLIAAFPFAGVIALFIAPAVARIGFKRTFLWAWGGRKFVFALLIATPWVLRQWGPGPAFAFVAGVVVIFALLRAVAITALMPWVQEFVPDSIRGKYSAVQNVVMVIAGASAMAGAGMALGDNPPLGRFTFLFVVALVFGLFSVIMYTRVPGGAPIVAGEDLQRADFGTMLEALGDRQFVYFLAGAGLVSLGWGPMAAFLPLYLKDQVGLAANQVIFLESIKMGAGLLSSFFWGWTADRYGGKPVMLINLAVLFFFPMGVWLLPHNSPLSYSLAIALYAGLGLALPGWGIGYSRLLYVNIIPRDRRTGYNAIHTAWAGVTNGISPLIAGFVLQQTKGLSGSFWLMNIDSYTPLLVWALVLLAVSLALMSRLRRVGAVSVPQFASLFFQGNPVAAVQALIAYRRGGPEERRVGHIERLGQAMSPLNVDELIEGLRDPSFNVRYEAIISIARTRPDSQLTGALVDVLRGNEPDLCIAAAWALGRIGDRAAIAPLREALDSEYPLLAARAARALGTLGDHQSAPRLLERFLSEQDVGLRLAYAAALGALRAGQALQPLLRFLDQLQDDTARRDAALAIAAIVGKDERHVRLWRKLDGNTPDALAGYLFNLRRRLVREDDPQGALRQAVQRCARAFGKGDMSEGVLQLRQVIAALPLERMTLAAANVLQYVVARLEQTDSVRLEYVTLCLHAVGVGFEDDEPEP